MEHPEYQIRLWALDAAVLSSPKGTSSEEIIKKAEKFYGFMLPQNGHQIKLAVKGKENGR